MTLEPKFSLFPEGKNEPGPAPDTFESLCGRVIEVPKFFWAEIGKSVLFEVSPEIFDGIKFRSVGGKEFDIQALALAGDEVPHQSAAVNGRAIPEDHQFARHMPQQMGQNPSAVQPGTSESADVTDPNAINTSTWQPSWSFHSGNTLETPIGNSGYDLKMYNNTTINVTYPTASAAHFGGAAVYAGQMPFPYAGVPENAQIAEGYLKSQGITPDAQLHPCP